MKKIGSIIIICLVIFFSVIAFNYINYRNQNAISDAAFIKTDQMLNLSFKVKGKVIKLTKLEGEKVKKGEILAKIDDIDFILKQQKLKNEISSVQAKVESLKIKKDTVNKTIKIKIQLLNNKKSKLTLNINALQFKIDGLNAKIEKLNKDITRYKTLYKQKLIQKEKLEALLTKQKQLSNQISAQNSKLVALKLDYKDIQYNIELVKTQSNTAKEIKKQIDSLKKQIDSLTNSLELINNQISYTTLVSPIDAIVAKRFINQSRVVQSGSLIYSIVNLKNIHLEVLLSEKKLHGVKVGNSVKITVDALKNKEFKGKVSSILPASASTFSLVPRDIASGEFTKLDQRFIVRIDFDKPSNQLKVGMGATVAIERK